jgi:fanconi anemia group M protein
MISIHHPLIRAVAFVGQSKKGGIGLTQIEQKEIMKKFRENQFNTLISTCVGEEGLDIGDVDLIICFDANKSPTRSVQRMGRTGRKRDGKVVMLLTEGKEYQVLHVLCKLFIIKKFKSTHFSEIFDQ